MKMTTMLMIAGTAHVGAQSSVDVIRFITYEQHRFNNNNFDEEGGEKNRFLMKK